MRWSYAAHKDDARLVGGVLRVPADTTARLVTSEGPEWCAPPPNDDVAIKRAVALLDRIETAECRGGIKSALRKVVRGQEIAADLRELLMDAGVLIRVSDGALAIFPAALADIGKNLRRAKAVQRRRRREQRVSAARARKA